MANNFKYMFNSLVYDDTVLEELEKYSKEYEKSTDREIYMEIDRIQAEVSNDIKLQHVKNLELMAEIQGFAEEDNKVNVDLIKELLKVEEDSTNSLDLVKEQYLTGSSLLLWFLLVTLLYRSPRRSPFRRGFRRSFRRSH